MTYRSKLAFSPAPLHVAVHAVMTVQPLMYVFCQLFASPIHFLRLRSAFLWQISNLTFDMADGMCLLYAMSTMRPDLRLHSLTDFAVLNDTERAQYLFAHLHEVRLQISKTAMHMNVSCIFSLCAWADRFHCIGKVCS
jgi:hypothetical protein